MQSITYRFYDVHYCLLPNLTQSWNKLLKQAFLPTIGVYKNNLMN